MSIEEKVIQKFGEITAELAEVNEILYELTPEVSEAQKTAMKKQKQKLQAQHDLLTEILKK